MNVVQCKRCTKVLLLSSFAGHDKRCQVHSRAATTATSAAVPVVGAVVQGSGPVVGITATSIGLASSTRMHGGTGLLRAPPTPPKLIKLKKPVDHPSTSASSTTMRRKEVSVLEISKGDSDQGKVTIVVERDVEGETAGPSKLTLTDASGSVSVISATSSGSTTTAAVAATSTTTTSSSAKPKSKGSTGNSAAKQSSGGGAPLASRRWTRRNKLTGLSLSFTIADNLAEEEGLGLGEEDFNEGWTYVRERREHSPPPPPVAPRPATEKRRLDVVEEVSTKKFRERNGGAPTFFDASARGGVADVVLASPAKRQAFQVAANRILNDGEGL